tara:strand:+ start:4934 stop:5626 length:693 start_codon:yes stop_codon:yes gene_type:complete
MSNVELNPEQILGLQDSHIIDMGQQRLDAHTAHAFTSLQEAAARDGFALEIVSSYRSFERQAWIWNQKATGQRPVLDIHSVPIDIKQLTPEQLVEEILNWSALPGTSRHHWGTDFDIYDAKTMTPETLQLIPQEYESGGPCASLFNWLSQHAHNYHFFWPYASERGGIHVEPWHLSYAPRSNQALHDFPEALLYQTLEQKDIKLKEVILPLLPQILKKYVYNINHPPFTS